jgi:hypothetical protein
MLSDEAKRLMDNPIDVDATPDAVREAFGENVEEFMRYVRRWGRVNQFPNPVDFAKNFNPAKFELWPGMPSDDVAALVQEAFEHRSAWDNVREYLAKSELEEIPKEFVPFIQAVMRDNPPPKYTKADRYKVFGGLEQEDRKHVHSGLNKQDRDRWIAHLRFILEKDYGLKNTSGRETGDMSTADVIHAVLPTLEASSIMNMKVHKN